MLKFPGSVTVLQSIRDSRDCIGDEFGSDFVLALDIMKEDRMKIRPKTASADVIHWAHNILHLWTLENLT